MKKVFFTVICVLFCSGCSLIVPGADGDDEWLDLDGGDEGLNEIGAAFFLANDGGADGGWEDGGFDEDAGYDASVDECDPSEGSCCYQGQFLSAGSLCFSQIEYSMCSSTDECGAQLQAYTSKVFCDGVSSECDYSTVQNFVELIQQCTATQICQEDGLGNAVCGTHPSCF